MSRDLKVTWWRRQLILNISRLVLMRRAHWYLLHVSSFIQSKAAATWMSSYCLIMARSQKWPDLRSPMTFSFSPFSRYLRKAGRRDICPPSRARVKTMGAKITRHALMSNHIQIIPCLSNVLTTKLSFDTTFARLTNGFKLRNIIEKHTYIHKCMHASIHPHINM